MKVLNFKKSNMQSLQKKQTISNEQIEYFHNYGLITDMELDDYRYQSPILFISNRPTIREMRRELAHVYGWEMVKDWSPKVVEILFVEEQANENIRIY